ncbi:mrdB [Wigglesworthia glossinidia endosymbiont of Glossina brevipalpis]|uniref:Peptidoglycan glycosyltransferase MrdB n=1 Tax=Wigglesworthia glossinidia brevipalpis TaxID=36870 RepID=Q8D328_WIGBR|nr:mrdB [Wigglesworthia glossinidia endosymbiont of Glossina brevipalpis]
MYMYINFYKKFFHRKIQIDFMFITVILLLLIYSIFIIWSASGKNLEIIQRKIIQIWIGMLIMIFLSYITPKEYEKLAPYLYFLCITLLISVHFFGKVIKGAKRWLDFGIIQFQPAEIAKIAVPLMISRIVNRSDIFISFRCILLSFILILIPTFLVAKQPDLGTSILIFFSGIFVLFLSGISIKIIFYGFSILLFSIPILWNFLMHDYQRNRIKALLNPELDPLGIGYHILQSKIAIGSGGLYGKGWLSGTQSQLEFLPERHTDFIFSVLGEEFGFLGSIILLLLYLLLIIRGLIISMQANNIFCKVISGSLILTLFLYIFVNIGMVCGILPIVGVPLPLISYGGSALIALMSGFGIIISINNHKNVK